MGDEERGPGAAATAGGRSSAELVEEALGRIEALDGRLGAFVAVPGTPRRRPAGSGGRCTAGRWRSRT